MRIIDNGRDLILKFWGNPSPRKHSYRLMRYHVSCICERGEALLNTVTGELVLLEKNEKAIINSLPSPYKPEMDDLISHRFLVPDEYDEFASVNQLRKILRRLETDYRINTFSILPTSSCNARCFYCYEAGYPQYSMTDEIASQVVHYIVGHCDKEKYVNLHWFGGEPTVENRIIDLICDKLCEQGIQYRSSMISNGYLFSKEMVHKAKEKWNLKSIQITLDGTEEIYNRTKSFTNVNDSPFVRVMNNIGYLLDEGIHVGIRMNLDFYNYDDIKTLINDVTYRFAGKDNFSAYVHELFEGEGYVPVKHGEAERRRLIELVQDLNRYISEQGCRQAGGFNFRKSLPSLRVYYCMADNPSSVMINPIGQIGKCEHEIFTNLVGDIYHDELDETENSYWLSPSYRLRCRLCKLYPFCGRMESCKNESDCLDVQANFYLKTVEVQMINSLEHALDQYKEGQDIEEAYS